MRAKKKFFVIMLFASCLMCVVGCETTKGVAVGVGATAIGVGKDAKTAWNGIKTADDWIKKNLW